MGRKPSVNLNLPPRMRARRQRSGVVYYYYDTGETPRREIPLGNDYVLAVQEWAKLHGRQAPAKITVGWVISQYLVSPKYTELGAGTQADYKFAIDKLMAKFGDAPIDEVRPSHIETYIELRTKGDATMKPSKHRALREVAVLGRIFKYARSKEWTKNDPIEPVEREKLKGRADVYIEDEMLDAVYKHAGQPMRDAMDLAYLLGQRPIDVLGLQETKLKDGTIELRQTKRGAPIRVAVGGDLAEVIERIMARKRTYAVRSLSLLVDEKGAAMTKAKLRSRFEAARDAAGIAGKDFQFRDLRAKAATDLRDSVNLEASQALLGHRSITMTEHYTRMRRGKIIEAIPKKKSGSESGK